MLSPVTLASVCLLTATSLSLAAPNNLDKRATTPITANFQPYQLYQCNLGTFPFQAPTTLEDGKCNTFSPANTVIPYIQGYQGYKASLNNPDVATQQNKQCKLVFYESNACGTLGQTTNAVDVPLRGDECKPITLDPLGTLISNGARSVLMNCVSV